MKSKITTKSSGFTLIELLVVISIIGLLSSIILVSVGQTRVKSRDAKRLADLQQIQKGLELYYAKVGNYPQTIPINQNTAQNWNDMEAALKLQGIIVKSGGQPRFYALLSSFASSLISEVRAFWALLPPATGVQDPLYPDRWYGYVTDYFPAGTPQNYRIRGWLEDLTNVAIKNTITGAYIYSDVTAGANACDPALGYFCLGSGGTFNSGYDQAHSSLQR